MVGGAVRQRGQALTELALSSVVLMLILLGLIDFSRVFYFDTALQEAAREGARHAALYNSLNNSNPYLNNTDIKTMVDRVLAGAHLPASTLQSQCPGSGAPPNPPYSSSLYPVNNNAGVNQPWLYICYNASAVTNQQVPTPTGSESTAPACVGVCGGFDVLVALLMNYGMVEGFMPSQLGGAFPMVGYAHIQVQGA